jgi:hypothetical protein
MWFAANFWLDKMEELLIGWIEWLHGLRLSICPIESLKTVAKIFDCVISHMSFDSVLRYV